MGQRDRAELLKKDEHLAGHDLVDGYARLAEHDDQVYGLIDVLYECLKIGGALCRASAYGPRTRVSETKPRLGSAT